MTTASVTCYNCFEVGHRQNVCVNLRKCKHCKQPNHDSSSCCSFCKDNTHPTEQCRNHNVCYYCGSLGHRFSFCPVRNKCFNCGKYGHKSTQCHILIENDKKKCYICSGDHIAKNCTYNVQQKKERTCNICYTAIGKALINCCGQRLCRSCKSKWFCEQKTSGVRFSCPFCRAPQCSSYLLEILNDENI